MIASTRPEARAAGHGGRPALLLAVSNLHLRHGPIPALQGVSFEVAQGSTTAIVGSAGAGKTSVLQAIGGLVRPSAGSRWWPSAAA